MKLEKNHGLPVKNLEWKQLQQNKDGSTLCLNCHKVFAALNIAKRHFKEQHMNVKKIQCDICQGFYGRKWNLMKHMKNVHLLPSAGKDAKLNSFKCLYCESSFTQKANLKRHVINIHKEMKNYL